MSNTEATPITSHFNALQTLIDSACSHANRDSDSVLLLAVSKTQSSTAVAAAYDAGLRAFGENYVQEGIEKIAALRQMYGAHTAKWHFIGPLQSNKTRQVAENFDWVHTIERMKIAQRLSEQRPAHLPDLNVCLQVNISSEPSKSGCAPNEAVHLCMQISQLPRLKLRGLMAIPAPIDPTGDTSAQQAPFVALSQLHSQIKTALPIELQNDFDTLSMGMSNDFEHAIAAGATIIRIGSALFGARDYPQKEKT